MRRLVAAILILASVLAPRAVRAERPVRVGSKHFTEQLVLGELAAQLLEASGIAVERRFGLQGTLFCFEALRAGEVDLYPEYTGTGLVAILKDDVPEDARLVTERVRQEFLTRWDLVWLAPLGFNNTYALGMRKNTVAEKHLRTMSDLAKVAPELALGCGTEFLARSDGYPGLQARYKIKFREARAMDPGLTYDAVAKGAVDVIDAYATDGRLDKFDLATLQDDLHFFPPYDAAFLVRRDAFTAHPGLASVLQRLAYRIDDAAMRSMNHEVDALGRTPAQVAKSFLERSGLAGQGARPAAGAVDPVAGGGVVSYFIEHRSEIARHTWVHLQLTFAAVLLALLAGVPLGIRLARSPRAAGPALAVVSALQTLPSLALLGFLIPITGIGARPAVLALFLYALLPIVRNTFTGVSGVPAELRDAGVGMGMTARQLLWMVELPLALPVIIAGARTATVITVGTATLAALIGAGGLGEPIFRGIALVDGPTILSGAIPATVLALGFDWLLGALQRRLLARA